MAKRKGINAKAWFYSQSFHSNTDFTPSPELSETIKERNAEFAKVQSAEQDFGGAFDGNRVTSDADEGL